MIVDPLSPFDGVFSSFSSTVFIYVASRRLDFLVKVKIS